MKCKKILIVLTAFMFLFPVNVYAETDPGWGSQTPKINLPYPSDLFNSTWSKPISDAYSAWNSTSNKVNVRMLSTSKNRLYAAGYSDTWYGNSSPANPGPFTIKLNARTINNDAYNLPNFIKSTMVHELGHIFCLDHTTKTSIMNGYRNRNTMTTPQKFDITEVNSVYK